MSTAAPPAGRGTGELDLRDHLEVLRRQRWVVAVTVVVVAGIATALTSLQTPVYESTAEVHVQPLGATEESSIEAELRRRLHGDRELETQRELVTSRGVGERVVADLGLDVAVEELTDAVDVRREPDTQVLEIIAAHTDADQAAALAQGFAEAYLADRRDRALDQLLAAEADVRQRTRNLRQRIIGLADEIQRVEQDPSGPGEQLAVLVSERDNLLAQLGEVTSQTARLPSDVESGRGGGRIIHPAAVPEAPVSPKPLRNGILAVVLGAMLGVGLGYLRDFLDDAVRSDDDAVRAVHAPVLGHIPRDNDRDGPLVTLTADPSPAAEAFRTLRSNVRFVLEGGPVAVRDKRSLAVTSAVSGEGKTNTACNLALAAATAGRRVLLVDADLRRPGVAGAFGLERTGGLSEVLVGELDLTDAVTDVGVPRLRVMTTGRIPPNPAELLASDRMRELMVAVERAADVVIYDTAPVLAVADTLEVAPHVIRTLLVVDVERTGRRSLATAADRLRGVGAQIAGCVLNNVPPGGDAYYHGYLYEGYEPDRDDRVAVDGAGPDTEAGRGPGSGDSSRRGRVRVVRGGRGRSRV